MALINPTGATGAYHAATAIDRIVYAGTQIWAKPVTATLTCAPLWIKAPAAMARATSSCTMPRCATRALATPSCWILAAAL